MLICRDLDPLVLPSETSQALKQRLLSFVRSLSTVLTIAHCSSSLIQQAQKLCMEANDSSDERNMRIDFTGKAVYTAIWVAAVSLLMELLGISTQKWLTAGGLGTVLISLSGREIFTNFLSSIMIHATRPFVVNERIQTKIKGYEVTGKVEHVGWWSPTRIRGSDCEAVHIPNHNLSINVVRNLSKKSHWRIKTHLAISHLDVNKINSIIADMRKVLAKNPQVEQRKLHRRVFLENIDPENQALMSLLELTNHTNYICDVWSSDNEVIKSTISSRVFRWLPLTWKKLQGSIGLSLGQQSIILVLVKMYKSFFRWEMAMLDGDCATSKPRKYQRRPKSLANGGKKKIDRGGTLNGSHVSWWYVRSGGGVGATTGTIVEPLETDEGMWLIRGHAGRTPLRNVEEHRSEEQE
ncbi:hypothetical protein V8G54_008884 [Vigna mungo]|uniref:Uncharacterized protein n=1 Tax=Vigna mungo TaxID=3915 RepID=A0AAQ3P6I5_VIGMU